ncbi:MAG: hypothetical protein JWP34_4627, partial [Massilia sp.]|nr:hypothetical protein [Massilia sp.]
KENDARGELGKLHIIPKLVTGSDRVRLRMRPDGTSKRTLKGTYMLTSHGGPTLLVLSSLVTS